MAQQKKKTTTTKKKTTGSSRSSSSGKRTAKKNQKRPIRREVAGAILLVLALCLGFSYFQSGAWLLDQPAKLCRSLFGWGYYLVAPALLLGSYILLFHRGRNVASCLVGTALLPVVFGAIMHIALCKEEYVNMDGILKLLWMSGNALESGGAVSASLAIMLVLLVKKVLAMVLLVVLFVAFLMMAFRLTPAAVIEAVRSHERVPYEPVEEEDLPPQRTHVPRRSAPVHTPDAAIDIPLDGEERVLDAGMGLITDGERPVALAGVMGGMDSEIEDDTVDVMVESACFNAGRTSHTSRDLSLISDASIRFERQVDETGCVDVANVTCALIEEIAGGEVAPGYVDVFPAPKTIDSIKLRLARVHAICGADIESDFIERSLTRLGCTVERDGEDFMVTPPSFRPDLPREIDLIEEVLRLWGMGRVTATIPAAKNHIGGLTREQKLTRKVGEILRACGLNETTTFGFAAPGDLEKIGMSTEGRGCPVVLMNPLVAEQTEMRRSLLPGLLQSVAYNEAHGTPNVHLYEVGSLFHGRENASLPKEIKSVAGVLSGQWSEQSWNMKYRKLRFFFGKGIVEELLAQLRIEKVRFRPVEGEGYAFLQPGRAAEVLSGGTVLGWVGEIHPEAREAMGIDEVVVAFELDLDKLIKGARNQENYREFSQYPAVEHDLAIVVDNSVTCEDLERRIASAGGKLLEGVRLFDVYRDPVRVGVGKKSMAFALTYRSDDHTLTSEEVEKAHQKIVTKVCKGVNGEVRG